MENKELMDLLMAKLQEVSRKTEHDEHRNFNTMKIMVNYLTKDEELANRFSEKDRAEALSSIGGLVQKQLGAKPMSMGKLMEEAKTLAAGKQKA